MNINKSIRVATLGAVAISGTIFHRNAPVPPRMEQGTVTVLSSAAAAPVNDGPWIASCDYWSAARIVDAEKSGDASPSDVTVAQTAHAQPQPQAAATCGPEAWGIPSIDTSQTQISAIIATVPDPIHSHLALDFDRSIDAMLQAGAKGHYLTSNYWLPWRSQIQSAGQLAATASKPTPEDSARERQPGLIVLRYAPDLDGKNQADTSGVSPMDYRRVIYLFLVAETPALGVNGNQLENAFHYEAMLQSEGAKLSVSNWSPGASSAILAAQESNNPVTQHEQGCPDHKDQLSIIGPLYSGSAASLHAGVEAALASLCSPHVAITGITGTAVAAAEMDPANEGIYHSFGEDVSYEQDQFLQSLSDAGYDLSRVVVLSEAGTVFGGAAKFSSSEDLGKKGTILNLRFPRELSLLRNAEPSQSSAGSATPTPTPYLNLSLKDYSADDTVPRFSTVQSPLSIEAQLMAIAQQIERARSQFIVISASNVLDDLFLAQFLHRACPDARLTLMSGGDLLFERDANNASYIGSISISPYLLSSLDFGNRVQYLYADHQAEEIYNAAIFTFRNGDPSAPPELAGYRNYPVSNDHTHKDEPAPAVQFQQIPLWATVVGADGYYPLAVLSWCSSANAKILPTILEKVGEPVATGTCKPDQPIVSSSGALKPQHVWDFVPESINQNSGILPSLSWGLLAGFVIFACIGHCIILLGADLWSPVTRDLAIDQNDLPYRRSVHLNIGTSVLASIAFVISYPLLRVGHYFHLAPGGDPLALILLAAAAAAVVCTSMKTWRYRSTQNQPLYGFFNFVAVAALMGIIVLWTLICGSDTQNAHHTYAGLYFCYRCLRPLNRVCPLLPILLLLFSWYLWSIYQTARLRFSSIHRPRIARLPETRHLYSPADNAYDLFVPDDALESCARLSDACLYQNITSLLISREVISRLCVKLKTQPLRMLQWLAIWLERHLNKVLGVFYFALFLLCIYVSNVRALDHFLFSSLLSILPAHSAAGPTLYEFLVIALFFPLIMVVLSGWLRVILIWGSLSRGLLEPLERMPIRFAFSRFDGGGWFSMLRQKGLHVRWRDMARSTEAIRQLVHHPDLKTNAPLYAKLMEQYEVINCRIYELFQNIKATAGSPPFVMQGANPSLKTTTPLIESRNSARVSTESTAQQDEQPADPCFGLWDLPANCAELCDIYQIEQAYARFCTILIEAYLAPYWDLVRTGFVEDTSLRAGKAEPAKEPAPSEPSLLQQAEELIVVRYVALIRAVLINIRYLMLFVSTAFVLAIVGWNSYPFQPHAFIDQCFTILMAILTLGFVGVFAQMHRNAILSRITNTNANELGWEFYLRLFTFGGVPFLTWFAYQFPDIGGSLYRIVQPGLQAMK